MEPVRKEKWKRIEGNKSKYWGTPTFEQQMVEERPKEEAKVWGKRKKRMRSEWYEKFLKFNNATCYTKLSRVIKSVHCNRTLTDHWQV